MAESELRKLYKPLFDKNNIFKFIIIVLILFVNKIPDDIIIFFQSLQGKLLVAILICYLVYYEPTLAVLITLLYVFMLNEYNKRYKKDIESFIKLYKNGPTCRNNFNLI